MWDILAKMISAVSELQRNHVLTTPNSFDKETYYDGIPEVFGEADESYLGISDDRGYYLNLGTLNP